MRRNEVNERCRNCINLRTMAPQMDGNHICKCMKNPRFNSGHSEDCQHYKPQYTIDRLISMDAFDKSTGEVVMHIDFEK